MKKTFRFFGMMLCIMLMAVNFTACSDNDDDDKNPSIVGTWETISSDGYVSQITYNANGSCFWKEWNENNPNDVEIDVGRYIVNGNTLAIWWESESDEEDAWTTFTFKIEGNRMTTDEGDGIIWIRK